LNLETPVIQPLTVHSHYPNAFPAALFHSSTYPCLSYLSAECLLRRNSAMCGEQSRPCGTSPAGTAALSKHWPISTYLISIKRATAGKYYTIAKTFWSDSVHSCLLDCLLLLNDISPEPLAIEVQHDLRLHGHTRCGVYNNMRRKLHSQVGWLRSSNVGFIVIQVGVESLLIWSTFVLCSLFFLCRWCQRTMKWHCPC